MRIRNPLPIRVHCWGGLGSQLYAWALYEDIVLKYPHRKFVLLLHNSGLTKRSSDLQFLKKDIDIHEIHDYKSGVEEAPTFSSQDKVPNFRNILKSCAVRSKLLVYIDNNQDMKRLRFWTVSIRGHYSMRIISDETLKLMRYRAVKCGTDWFNTLSEGNNFKDSLSIHLRLGDLLLLKTKKPISFDVVAKQVNSIIARNSQLSNLIVASDSPALVLAEISTRLSKSLSIEIIDEDPWSTITKLVKANYFLGTNSKISVWVSLLMLKSDKNVSIYLPSGALNHLKNNLENFSLFNSVYEFKS
jgi:hypothetical protein